MGQISLERIGAMLNGGACTFVKSDHLTRFSGVDFIVCVLCFKVQQKSIKCQGVIQVLGGCYK